MAKKVAEFPKAIQPGRARYDYAAWFDGSVWMLERGVDYDSRIRLAQSLYQRAWRMGGRVSIRSPVRGSDKRLYVQFTKGAPGPRRIIGVARSAP